MGRKRHSSSTALTAIDLFSGCGGATQGLKDAGLFVVAAVEKDAHAAQCYRANHPDVLVVEQDIRNVSPTFIMSQSGPGPHLILGSPPCQGFSRIRTRNAEKAVMDVRNTLYLEFLRFVEQLLPPFVLFENVPGFQRDYAFDKLRLRLVELGYNVCYSILDAADFGIPQRRKRFILTGVRCAKPQDLRWPLRPRKTLAQLLRALPPGYLEADSLHNLPQKFSSKVRERIGQIPTDGGSRRMLSKRIQLRCHGKHNGFFDVYGRMRWDDVAPTITSGVYSPSKGRFLHPEENRCISLREAALIQTFPLKYRFPITIGKMKLAEMIGNAFPPTLVKCVTEALIRQFQDGQC